MRILAQSLRQAGRLSALNESASKCFPIRSFAALGNSTIPAQVAANTVISTTSAITIHTNNILRPTLKLDHAQTLRFKSTSSSEPKKSSQQRGFVPRKAALKLSNRARKFCSVLLQNMMESKSSSNLDSPANDGDEDVVGIMLKYQMSTAGQMKMVFKFEFARTGDIGPEDEGVSLEVLEDGSPKPPSESENDGKPKLYIHHTAFMKVLGGTMDVDIKKDGSFTPIMYDREGNLLDPNV